MNDSIGSEDREHHLFERWKQGCTESRDLLLQHWIGFIHMESRRALGPKLRGKLDSLDIVQEVFLDLLAMSAPPARIATHEDFHKFLRVVIRNTIRDKFDYYFKAIRRCGDLVRSLTHDIAGSDPTASDKIARLEETRNMLALLGLLPETQRAAILLRLEYDFSFQQIGELLECSANAAEKRYRRACGDLQKLERRIDSGELRHVLEEVESDIPGEAAEGSAS